MGIEEVKRIYIGKSMTVKDIMETIVDKDVFLKDVVKTSGNAVHSGVIFDICEDLECIDKLMYYNSKNIDFEMISTYRVNDSTLFL